MRDFINGADRAARRLGADENLLWTAFGPTNVTIHRVATSMELGDLQIALSIGPDLDTSAVPVERQVRHSLEVARALSGANRRDDAAVLAAEQKAPEQIRYHYLVPSTRPNLDPDPAWQTQSPARRPRRAAQHHLT